MLLIDCPFCGAQPELEFHCGGEAHIARPANPALLDDAQWAEFLFYRDNTKGIAAERWNHVHGCQRWFNVLRNTVSDEILATYKMGEARPAIAASAAVTPAQPAPANTASAAVPSDDGATS